MELPKNITQIGEVDKHCRIYVEDYVVSYIKQMNGIAQNKDIAIALYGRKTVEDGVSYVFVYGSAKLNFLQKAVRHLSQAQEQEIEKLRKKYFSEMKFLGYRILNGEMVEGFQICEQDICRYVEGYAQFYEKNDSMLAYMLENRGEEVPPEKVDQEKYETVRKRQEERRQHQEEHRQHQEEHRQHQEEHRRHRENGYPEQEKIIQMPTVGLRRMKMAATGVFVLLCVVALALMKQESTGESLGEAARQAMSSMMEQKIPDAEEEADQTSTLVAEDKLEDALRQENAAANTEITDGTAETVATEPPTDSNVTEAATQMTEETTQEATQEATQSAEPVSEDVIPTTPAPEPTAESSVQAVSQPVSYTIKRGDTLIGISIRNYGSNARVSEICSLNGIKDPDDIKIGQEILLP